MHDLRKQALGLESGKTMSRKARSKAGTPSPGSDSRPTSRANSRVASRSVSRNVSDDEGDFSDTTQWSTNSIDELIADAGDGELPQEGWAANLNDRINEILDRKRSSVQGREDTLQAFSVDLVRHYAVDELKDRVEQLVPVMLKSVKSEVSERETVLALKALALMLITVPTETLYDAVAGLIKATISDSEYPTAKMAAIRALSIATFYGGAAVEETEDVMDFLLEIVSSDGHSISEPDNAEIVVTALEEWGFLATQLEDMEASTEPAMETFVDQLESSDVGVQVAAGENIALLFEKSYTELESDEEPDEPADPDTDNDTSSHHMVKRYTVHRNPRALEATILALSKSSSKRLSKKDRKHLHLSFKDILHTVEDPTRGPRYSTALDEDGRELGSRLKVKLSGSGGRGCLVVDKWWKLLRLNALKRLLGPGFGVHLEGNEVVGESLGLGDEEEGW